MSTSSSGGLLENQRYAAITDAPFPIKEVYLLSARGVERLGEPFSFTVHLVSYNPIAHFSQLAGQTMTVGIKLANDKTRFLNGVITRFEYSGLEDNRRPTYHAELKSWLIFLEYRRNCRVFQEMTSVEIIKAVFSDHKQSNFREAELSMPFPRRPYCVQYNETDLAFVSRLMEQDGLYYYFEHSKNKHELVLLDNLSAHPAADSQTVVTHQNRIWTIADAFWNWQEVVQLQAGQVTLKDYNYENPTGQLTCTALVPEVRTGGVPPFEGDSSEQSGSADQRINQTIASPGISASHELFGFPGGYMTKDNGEFYAKIRTEELACAVYQARIEGCARQIKAGDFFKAVNPFKDPTICTNPSEKWLAVGVEFSCIGEYGGKPPPEWGERFYHSIVEAQPASTPYRSRQVTPRPLAPSIETAIVVGNDGESVTTDKYGRIKLRFFWDRKAGRSGDNSCWVRVAQRWAGKEFGDLVTPRIDQEVVVAFLHGIPDRPLVIGSVYNATNMPPENPLQHPVRSSFKTRSTAGSRRYNELRFEDTGGLEQVYLRAQKNYQVDVGEVHELGVGTRFSVASPCVLTPDGGRTETLGSRIDITPEKISFTLTTAAGQQMLELGPEGISLIGSAVTLFARSGPVTSIPFPVTAETPELATALADEAATTIADAVED